MSTDNHKYQGVLPPPTVLRRRDEKYILLSDGCNEHPVFIGGRFVHNGREYMVNDIRQDQMNINGAWHPKSDFEPADITIIKGKVKKKPRGIFR